MTISRLFWVLLLGLLVGCTSNLQRPRLAVTGATLGEIGQEGMTLSLAVDVSNPNPVSLPVESGKYALSLAGVRVIEGTAEPQKSVPANTTAAFALPIRLRWDDVLGARDAILAGGGDLSYDLRGSIRFGRGLLGVDVPLQHKGVLPLRSALSDPMLLLKVPKIRELLGSLLGR